MVEDTPKGVWSTKGIKTEVINEDHIKCISNHLTSFAILIDTAGIIHVRANHMHGLSIHI